jgi:hypothetical protein
VHRDVHEVLLRKCSQLNINDIKGPLDIKDVQGIFVLAEVCQQNHAAQ